MRHSYNSKKLNRNGAHRKALFANIVNSLLQYEQISTTLAKAKVIRPIVEKIITMGKNNTLAVRRGLLAKNCDKPIVDKLISTLSQRYQKRPGGYTRIIRAGFRYGDKAPMAVIELVDRDVSAKPKKTSKEGSEEKDTA